MYAMALLPCVLCLQGFYGANGFALIYHLVRKTQLDGVQISSASDAQIDCFVEVAVVDEEIHAP